MHVLFICQGNVNRSQIAETILAKIRSDVHVSSAGTMVPRDREDQPVSSVSAVGINAMREIGFDMTDHTMRQLTPEMFERADRAILVGETPGGPLPRFLQGSPKLTIWDVPDPGYGHIGIIEARDMIRAYVEQLAKTL